MRWILCLMTVAMSGCGRDPSPAGEWTARVAMGNQDSVHVVVDLGKIGARWVGEFDAETFGLENYPVQVSSPGPLVHLFFTGPEATFEGKVSRDGKQLAGTVTLQDLRKLPVTFRRTGDAQFSEMFLKLEQAADDSSLVEKLSADGAALRTRFNADHEKTRLLMLLSPT